MTKLGALNVATALAGALALASVATPASAQGLVKCYGVALKGQNSCANAANTHTCAGQAKVDFDGGEWRAVPSNAVCTSLAGSSQPTQGVNVAARVKFQDMTK